MSAECVFCKIAHHNGNAHIVYENQNLSCFLDRDPINEGHILLFRKLNIAI